MLLETVDGNVTQRFGLSLIWAEPSMFFDTEKAYWADSLHGKFPGSQFSSNFHPGIDRGAPEGTPVRAMESGVVSFSGWKDNISGAQIEVAINPTCWFSINHLSRRLVAEGDVVSQGQVIGEVGMTGFTTGPHTHEGLSIFEQDSDGIGRTFLYDPDLFLHGGKYANDPRIRPEVQHVQVDGGGVNIRKTPVDFNDFGNVFAISRTGNDQHRAGIFRRATGNRIGPLDYKFRVLFEKETEGGTFLIVRGFRRRLAIRKSLTKRV